MGEAQDKWEAMRQKMHRQMEANGQDAEDAAAAMHQAMYDLANDMTYPVDAEGNQVNMHWLIPMLSFHLARCGYRKVKDAAVIKQIPHPRAGKPQVAEDAVLYVPVDAAGEIPDMYVNVPEDDPGAPVMQPWKTRTHITFEGETIKGGPR